MARKRNPKEQVHASAQPSGPEPLFAALSGGVQELARWAQQELARVEVEIGRLTVQREELVRALAWARGFPAQPASASAPASVVPPAARGSLWERTEAALRASGELSGTELRAALAAAGVELGTRARYLYNSLGRWHREGKLERRARGRYRLANAAAESVASGRFSLWSATEAYLRQHGEVRARELVAALSSQFKDRKNVGQQVRNALNRWTKANRLQSSRRGYYKIAKT